MSEYLSPQLRLVGVFELTFKLINETGLLIRSGKGGEVMGSADIMPMSADKKYDFYDRPFRVPYIPGSSLKGRARSMLELALGLGLSTSEGKIYYHMRVVRNDIVHDDPYCPVDNVFGSASVQPQYYQPREGETSPYAWFIEKCWAPTRAIFRDLFPSANYMRRLCEEKGGCDYVLFDDFIEEKNENRIDRVTSAADPRSVLRVRPGVEFEGSISFLVFDLDICRRSECEGHSKLKEYIRDYPARYYLQSLVEALMLVEETYIGGSGTRGYGNVKFRDIVLSLHNLAANEPAPRELGRFRDLRELRDFIDKMTVFDDIKKIVCGST